MALQEIGRDYQKMEWRMIDVKYDEEKIKQDAEEWLSIFAKRMKDLASEIIGEIEVGTVPHLETDAWTNYREALRIELEHDYRFSKFKSDWATNFRRAVFVENREEISKLITEDILKRIKELEDRHQEFDIFRYTPKGDEYQSVKRKLDRYVETYGDLE